MLCCARVPIKNAFGSHSLKSSKPIGFDDFVFCGCVQQNFRSQSGCCVFILYFFVCTIFLFRHSFSNFRLPILKMLGVSYCFLFFPCFIKDSLSKSWGLQALANIYVFVTKFIHISMDFLEMPTLTLKYSLLFFVVNFF